MAIALGAAGEMRTTGNLEWPSLRRPFFVPPMPLASLPPAIGNAHLLLLHLPIGFMVAAVLLEVWTWRDAAGRRLLEKILATNVVFTLLAAAAGLVLAEGGGYAEAGLARHRWAGVACAAAAVLAWWLRARRGLTAARIGLLVLVVVTCVAGHFGATLTHGGDLFSWSARPAASAEPEAVPRAAGGPHPILVKHCVECHGPERAKGRLRLDTLTEAMKAGRSGRAALTPGDATRSELIRRITLAADDDDVMPPREKGRAALREDEKTELARWVEWLGAR